MASLRDIPSQGAEKKPELPFYEKGTDAYKRDLEERRGGLKIGRQVDMPKILAFTEQIKAGALPDEDIELLIHRNPGAAALLSAAKKNRETGQRFQDIISRNTFSGVQSPFQQQGPVQPGAEPLPVIQKQGPSFNQPQALQMLASEGILTPERQATVGGMAEAFAPPEAKSKRGTSTTLQEMEFLNSLPESDRESALALMLNLKRAGKVVDINEVPHVVNPDNTVTPLSDLGSVIDASSRKEAEVAAKKIAAESQAKNDVEFMENTPQRMAKRRLIEDKMLNVEDSIESALGKAGNWTTGIPGAVGGLIPGTEAFDLNQDLETIKANLGFDRLEQMREASPTGGALGQVAVQELIALQASIKSLDRKQTPATLKRNLVAVRKQYRKWRAANERAKSEEAKRLKRLGVSGDQEQPTIPEGLTADEWKYMTPEERALFQ